MIICRVFDAESKLFDQPRVFDSEAMAIRSFALLVNDGESIVSKYPEDFSIWRVASASTDVGELTSETPAVQLTTAKAVINHQE